MKKSVILLIFIIYIASIAVVGFYGIKIKVYDEKVMVEDIICENLSEFGGSDCAKSDITYLRDLYEKDKVNYYAYKKYSDDYATAGFVIHVQFAVLPREATQKGIEYSSEQTDRYTVTDNGDGSATITIYKKGSVVFYVTAQDKAAASIVKKVRIDVG